MSRKHGFTLIELLVVIAIIGILAAMLFPVFARAREAARKIQCLSNVKNIAMAVQLYLTDYDALWPFEHNAEALQLWYDRGGCDDYWAKFNGTMANPYLREAVLLDEYVKNRDIWRCPSAKMATGATVITSTLPGRPYWQDWTANQDVIGCVPAYICDMAAFPPGWGGTVTDSLTDRVCGGVKGSEGTAFYQSIRCNVNLYDLKTSAAGDPSRYVAVGEQSVGVALMRGAQLAYSDLCGINWNWWDYWCAALDEPNPDCPWTADCELSTEQHQQFWADPTFRKKYARHMGGVNLGFLDGHAKWYLSDAVLSLSPGGHGPGDGQMVENPDPYFEGGLCVCTP